MGATTGLVRQEDGFDKLLKLASLNAKDIASAGEESRRQMQLTQEEQAKVAEARTYIVKHASLEADLKRREEGLAIQRTAHELSVSDFAAHVAAENARLEALAASLDARDKISAENVLKTEQALKEAANLKVGHEKQHALAMADVNIAANANIEIGKKLVAEEQRLKEWEATLKGKAERIRQQAASF